MPEVQAGIGDGAGCDRRRQCRRQAKIRMPQWSASRSTRRARFRTDNHTPRDCQRPRTHCTPPAKPSVPIGLWARRCRCADMLWSCPLWAGNNTSAPTGRTRLFRQTSLTPQCRAKKSTAQRLGRVLETVTWQSGRLPETPAYGPGRLLLESQRRRRVRIQVMLTALVDHEPKLGIGVARYW